jgi:hypothetical protein
MDKAKKSLKQRLARMAQRHGVRTDAWHTSLPGTKSIEALDAQAGPWQPCRCCGYLTLSARGAGERCGVCAWVDVGDAEEASDVNDGLTLKQARFNFSRLGACARKYLGKTRSPRFKELPKHRPDAPSDTGPIDENDLEEYRQSLALDREKVPRELRDLLPLAARWGIGDDAIRSDAARLITERDKTALVSALSGRLGVIDRWLDSFPEGTMSDETAAFMYLTELVDELELEIPRD